MNISLYFRALPLGVLSFILCLNSSVAAEFHVKGAIKIKLIGKDSKITSQKDNNFEISVKDCKWFITTTPTRSGEGLYDYCETGSEGTNRTLQVCYYHKSSLQPNSLNKAIGLVEDDLVPENIADNTISEIWLAFASGCYLETNQIGAVKPIYNMGDPWFRAQNYAEKATWKLFQQAPHLLQELSYTPTNLVFRQDKETVELPIAPPFDKGFTRAVYKVVSTTNVSGQVFPEHFTFEEFAVLSPQDKPNLIKWREVEGIVTSVDVHCDRDTFVPLLKEPTYIDDRRFSRMPVPVVSSSYLVTNNVWPGFHEPQLQAMYQKEIKARKEANVVPPPAPAKATRTTKIVVAVLFLLISVISLGAVLLKTRKLSGENRQKNK